MSQVVSEKSSELAAKMPVQNALLRLPSPGMDSVPSHEEPWIWPG
jgi:hypothetical protein